MLASLVPQIVLGSVAGVYADRWDRRRTMVACELGRAVALGSVAVTAVAGGVHAIPVLQLAAVAFVEGSLFVLFTDETSGVTTYAANRSLKVDAPAPDGTVLLDFNRATNLPCAYTEFATCPLPPAENRLPVAVEAGEKKPLAG